MSRMRKGDMNRPPNRPVHPLRQPIPQGFNLINNAQMPYNNIPPMPTPSYQQYPMGLQPPIHPQYGYAQYAPYYQQNVYNPSRQQDAPPPYEATDYQRRQTSSPGFRGQSSRNGSESDKKHATHVSDGYSSETSSHSERDGRGRGGRGQRRGGFFPRREGRGSDTDLTTRPTRGKEVGRRGRGQFHKNQRHFRGARGGRNQTTTKSEKSNETGSVKDVKSPDSASVVSEDNQSCDEFDEYTADIQQQLVKELKINSDGENLCAALIRFTADEPDFDIQSFRHYIEWCSTKCGDLKELVLSTDKRYVVVVFYSTIDFDLLISNMSTSSFCEYELTCEHVNYCPALICFTNEGIDSVVRSISDLYSSKKILDKRAHEDYDWVLVSFTDLKSDDMNELVKDLRSKKNIEAFPLYPYPEEDAMYVTQENYYCFEKLVKARQENAFGQILLVGAAESIDLKRSMAIEKLSGGDSTAQIKPAFSTSTHYVQYDSFEVAYRVFMKAPIQLRNGDILHVVMSAGVSLTQTVGVSKYFILLSNVPKGVSSDLVKYFVANHTGKVVIQVFFGETGSDFMAVIMFSKEISKEEMLSLSRGLRLCDELMNVEAWLISPVTQLRFSRMPDFQFAFSRGIFDASARREAQSDGSVILTFPQENAAVKCLSNYSTPSCCPVIPFISKLVSTSCLSADVPDVMKLPRASLASIVVETTNIDADDLMEFLCSDEVQQRVEEALKSVCAMLDRDLRYIEFDTVIAAKRKCDVIALSLTWGVEVKKAIDQLIAHIQKTEIKCEESNFDVIKSKAPKKILLKKKDDKFFAIGFKKDLKKLGQLLALAESERTITIKQCKGKFYQLYLQQYPLTEFSVQISPGKEFATITIKSSEKMMDAEELDRKKEEIVNFLTNLVCYEEYCIDERSGLLLKNPISFLEKQLKAKGITVGCWVSEKDGNTYLELCALTRNDTLQAYEIAVNSVRETFQIKFAKGPDFKVLVDKIHKALKGLPRYVDIKPNKVSVISVAEGKELLENILNERLEDRTPLAGVSPKVKSKSQRDRLEISPISPSASEFSRQATVEIFNFSRRHHHIDKKYIEKKYKNAPHIQVNQRQIKISAENKEAAQQLRLQIEEDWESLSKVRVTKRLSSEKQRNLTGKDSVLRKYLKMRSLDTDAVNLVQYSQIKFFSSFGDLKVYGCCPDILTVPADVLLIAVSPKLCINDSTVGALLADVDPESCDALSKIYSPRYQPGECLALNVCGRESLYKLYLVVVVIDQDSVRTALLKAFETCVKRGFSSLVTNLIGSDMDKLVKPEESAKIIFSALTRHTELYGNGSVKSVYICEINDGRLESLKKEWIKYKSVEAMPDESSPCGALSVVVCSADERLASDIKDYVSDMLNE